MITIFRVLSMIAVLILPFQVHAQDAASTQLESSTQTKAKAPSAPPKDVDEEITNARLRASTGSKKRYSLQSAFTYNGGSIQKPLAKERPVLSPGTLYTDPAKLTGSVSGKFRMTDHDNINLGVGIGWLTPTYQGQRGQVENPYISYSRVFKAGRFQNVIGASITKYTADQAVDVKRLNMSIGADYTALTSFQTGTDVGVAFGGSTQVYKSGGTGLRDELGAFPFAEQSLTDQLSLRTVYRGFTYYNTTDDKTKFVRDDPTQSFGVGISVARDLYLYPNVQWVWGDIKSEKTNVALSANINL